MRESTFLADFVRNAAYRSADAIAIVSGSSILSYGELATATDAFASGLIALGLRRADRVGIYLDKRFETVIASFGAPAAGAVFVPINPLLKPSQVGYILADCNVLVLVTTGERAALLSPMLVHCSDLRHLVIIGAMPDGLSVPGVAVHTWDEVLAAAPRAPHRVIDTDMVAILYTSGSTGRPKGVVLSHRNMVAGAKSVASYLENGPQDVILAALPLSFDAGFSQLTTACHAGARVVLINYLLPMDVLNAIERERVTGLTAVPPLWIQLSQLAWPVTITEHLRYIANTGGRMPLACLSILRKQLPKTRPFLMYGLTEAFRSTCLPPEQVDRRPDSIGKAIPNAEILVLRDDGTECAADEPGELVHRGALVSMGYWNDAAKTAERYRLLPQRASGLVLPEIAVFSGDNVRRDVEGYLYFIGRRDEMIKTSGYRVSPTELEEVLYSSGLTGETAAFGVPHPILGQAIVVVVTPKDDGNWLSADALVKLCRAQLPAYMVPAHVDVRPGPLPRNPNGKIDRKTLSAEFAAHFEEGR